MKTVDAIYVYLGGFVM